MAIGFTPKYSTEFELTDLTTQHFIILGIKAAESLGWKVFYTSSVGFKVDTNRGMFANNELIKVTIVESLATLESLSLGNGMIDFGKNKRNIKRLITAIEEEKNNYTPEELQSAYEQLELVQDEDDDLLKPAATASENFKSFLSIFIPQDGYFVTPILLNLNLAVFIVMILSGVNAFAPTGESLVTWGANFKPVTTDGQPWRLITNCFLHIGVFHLLLNMYALVYIGAILEPYLGKTKFAWAYLFAGIGASTTSLLWHDMTISAGASGAIFGMYGVFLALLTTDFIHKDVRKPLLTSISVFVGYNLLYGIKGGIDNAAHIGGLLSGVIIGYAFLPSLKKPQTIALELKTILLLAVLTICSSFMIYNKKTYDFAKYDSEMKAFINYESMALEVYNLPENTGDEKLMYEIKDRGIYYWNENIKLINKLDQLYLPKEIHERNNQLLKYCKLRIKSYELMYKGLEDHNIKKYDEELKDYTIQIESMIKTLTGG